MPVYPRPRIRLCAARTRRGPRAEHVRRPGHDRGHRAAVPVRPARDRSTSTACCSSTGWIRRPARPRCGLSGRASGSAPAAPVVKVSPHPMLGRALVSEELPAVANVAHGRSGSRCGSPSWVRRARRCRRSARCWTPRHEVAAVITRPHARAGRGRPEVASSRRDRRRGGRRTGSGPTEGRRSRTSWRSSAELQVDCCAVGRLRRRSCRPRRWPYRRMAGSTCTSRCCRRGAARHRSSAPSSLATTSPEPRRSRSRPLWTTGPVYGVVTERIRPSDTAGDLLARLAESGAGLLVATMDEIADGTPRARVRSRGTACHSRPRSLLTTPESTGRLRAGTWTARFGRAPPPRARGRPSEVSG